MALDLRRPTIFETEPGQTISHTAGPWKAESCACGRLGCRYYQVPQVLPFEAHLSKGDATLIAAALLAPNILRAAIDLMDHLSFSVQTKRFRPSDESEKHLKALREAIRAYGYEC
jgi:hypothetical protein